MRPRDSRRLVIDATVAQASSGTEAVFPTSKQCRDFLAAVLQVCHQVVMTSDIRQEWRKHRSRYARTWYLSMLAHKKVHDVEPQGNKALHSKIEGTVTRDRDLEALKKDLLLVDAALATDCSVVSLDDEVRRILSASAQRVGEIRRIVWVNPSNVDEDPITWLGNGAKPQKTRSLGWRDEES